MTTRRAMGGAAFLLALAAAPVLLPPRQSAQKGPVVGFLDVQQGRRAITDDSDEPYFSLLRPHDMSAKTGRPITGATLDEQREECRRRYRDAVLEFTGDEKDMLLQAVRKLHPVLSSRYPRFASLPWSFLKVAGTIEGGFPHTRGDHVVLPVPSLANLERLRKRSPQDGLFRAASLLAHEQLHVYQRKRPRDFDGLYTDVWGFIRATRIEGCPWLDEHEAVNPDATDLGWIFPLRKPPPERLIWPRVIYRESESKDGRVYSMAEDFRMVAIEVEKTPEGHRVRMDARGRPLMSDLNEVPEYMRTFPGQDYVFHPAEAAAAYFGSLAAIEALVDPEKLQEKARRAFENDFGAVRAWFKEAFKDAR